MATADAVGAATTAATSTVIGTSNAYAEGRSLVQTSGFVAGTSTVTRAQADRYARQLSRTIPLGIVEMSREDLGLRGMVVQYIRGRKLFSSSGIPHT